MDDLSGIVDDLRKKYCGLSGEVCYNWGDGVLEDKDKEQAIQLNEVNSGIRKKTDYLKWRYGVDDKQAAEMLPESGVQSFFDEGGGS